MKLRLLPIVAAGALALATFTAPTAHFGAAAAATPPPTPPALPTFTPAPDFTQPPATPTPIPAPGALPPSPAPASISIPLGRHRPTATPAPPKDLRKGLEGVWEVQIQSPAIATAIYTHFKLKQDHNALTGVYLDNNGKQFALAGSVDGKTVRVVVSLADGSTLVFNGTVDGTTDMLGTMTDAKGKTLYFTAGYRAKENFLDNLSPAPSLGGGLGGSNGLPPV